MVTYELKEKNNRQLLYLYYPEGDKNKHPGAIVYDRIKKELFITDLAEEIGLTFIEPDDYFTEDMLKVIEEGDRDHNND